MSQVDQVRDEIAKDDALKPKPLSDVSAAHEVVQGVVRADPKSGAGDAQSSGQGGGGGSDCDEDWRFQLGI